MMSTLCHKYERTISILSLNPFFKSFFLVMTISQHFQWFNHPGPISLVVKEDMHIGLRGMV